MTKINSKRQLLILHGAIGAKDQFNELKTILSSDFEVLTINFAGHGGESIPDKFSIELFAQNVIDFLDSKNIDKIDIFGYSMGGYVALYLAQNSSEKIQDRIGKVFTFATKFEWNPEIASKESKMLNPEKIQVKVPAFAEVLAKRHSPQDWKVVLNKTAEMMIEMGNNNPLNLEKLNQIKQPVRIGIGDRDNMVSLAETISVYQSLPNASFIVFPDTQHPIEKINLDRLTNEIREWFI